MPVTSVLWEIYSYPPGWSAPSGWTAAASGRAYQYVAASAAAPPSFTLPASGTWGKWLFRATLNNALRNGVYDPTLIDKTAAVKIVGPYGLEDVAPFEEGQFSADAWWADALQKTLRTIGSNLGGGGGGGGGVALGTGTPADVGSAGAQGSATTAAPFNHVHRGVAQLAASSPITVSAAYGNVTVGMNAIADANVAAGAAIAVNKLAPSASAWAPLLTNAAGVTAWGNPGEPPAGYANVGIPASGTNSDTYVLTVPASPSGNSRFFCTEFLIALRTAVTGAGTLTVTAGTTAGGTDIMPAQIITSATANNTIFGVAAAQNGTAFDASLFNQAPLAAGTSISVRVATSGGTVGSPVLQAYVFGYYLS